VESDQIQFYSKTLLIKSLICKLYKTLCYSGITISDIKVCLNYFYIDKKDQNTSNQIKKTLSDKKKYICLINKIYLDLLKKFFVNTSPKTTIDTKKSTISLKHYQ
jgi:hypothetical protein